jgi:hypothetical protein
VPCLCQRTGTWRYCRWGCRNCRFICGWTAWPAFFLLLIGGVSAGVSAFAAGYFRKGEGTPPGLICLEYHVFLASIAHGGAGR